jgi:hypothetical protein
MEDEQVVEEVVVDNGPSAEEIAAQEAIDAIGAEFAPKIAAEPDPDAPEVEETPAQVDAPPPEPETDTPDERGLERLVAREVELREKEKAFEAERAQTDSYKARIAELEGQVAAFPKDLVTNIGVDPYGAFEAAGHDPDQVMRIFLAQKMRKQGKAVPQELQYEIDKAESRQRERALEDKFQRSEQAREAQAFAMRIENDAREYVKKGEFSKDAPTIAELAKAYPDEAYGEILDEIARDAVHRSGKDRGSVISFEEAAKRAEKRLAHYKKLLGPRPDASTNAATPKSTTVATKGASTTVPKKPLTVPKKVSDEDLLNQAINEGVSEFQRSEAARKRPTA